MCWQTAKQLSLRATTERCTMTTLNFSPSASLESVLKTNTSPSLVRTSGTDIGGDLDSLEQHMRHCADKGRRFPRLQLVAEDLHALASPRIITLVTLVVLLATATANAAIGIFNFI